MSDSPAWNEQGSKLCAISWNITNNELIAVQGHTHPALYHTKLIASDLHWISGSEPTRIQLKAKIRYRGKEKEWKDFIRKDIRFCKRNKYN